MTQYQYIKDKHKNAFSNMKATFRKAFTEVKEQKSFKSILFLIFIAVMTLLAYAFYPFHYFIDLLSDHEYSKDYLEYQIKCNNLNREETIEFIRQKSLKYQEQKIDNLLHYSESKFQKIEHTFNYLFEKYSTLIAIDSKNSINEVVLQPINKDFKSTLNEKQIETLVECINKIKVLETTVTIDIMKQILSCTTKKTLEIASKKNKLIIYLFNELNKLSYITSTWQAVCAQNKLFLTSEKKIFLNQDIISSTVNSFHDDPPKDSHIIDKYMKQLQEH